MPLSAGLPPATVGIAVAACRPIEAWAPLSVCSGFALMHRFPAQCDLLQ